MLRVFVSCLLLVSLGIPMRSKASDPAPVSDPAPAQASPVPLATLAAGSGLFQTLTAVPGAPWTFGLALHLEYFRYGDFLVAGQNETNTRTAGGVHFHMFFPHAIEAFATIYSVSNLNERDHLAATFEPTTQSALGDLLFGAKYSHRVTPFLNVGGALVARLYSGMGEAGHDLSATSVGVHLLGSLDGRTLVPRAPFPFLVHLNLGYVHDGSSKLLGSVPRSADFTTVEPLYGYMVQAFALGVTQSRIQFSLGFEAPLRVKGTILSPVVEYGFRLHTEGADDTLMGWRHRVAVNGNVAPDDTFSQNLTLGLRWHVTPRVAVSAGVDLALDYPGFAVAPPQPVYNVFAMLSYHAAEPKGPCVPEVREVVKEVDRTPKAEPMGTIHGKVTDEQGAPLEGATVDFVGAGLPRQATDAQGTFTSVPVKPGNYTVRVGRKDFHDAELPVTVSKTDAPTEVALKLKARGPEQCSVYVFVKDEAGQPVGGTLKVQGKTMDDKEVAQDVTLSAEGKAEVKVFPGAYEIVYSEPEHLTRSATVTLPKCAATPVELVVKKKPAKSTATINRKQRQITITDRIQFKLDSAELLAESLIILDEVAALMIDNPEILELEVQGHTDDKGKADHNLKLSQDRADAVREYIIKQGVKGDRLTAKGYGHTKPRFANISSRLREKNRRVEFKISKMKED
jgi:outer membrane protein OmpA-like peptidoglycan-associated protein